MQRKKLLVIVGVIIIMLLVGWAFSQYWRTADKNNGQPNQNTPASNPGKQICPDAWYDNQMPGSPDQTNSQYFIINGERAELEELDVAWVKANCAVKEPQVVY